MSDMTVQTAELAEVVSKPTDVPFLEDSNMNLLNGVEVEVVVELGKAKMTVKELFDLKKGGTITLDCSVESEVVVKLNQNNVAKGRLVVVDDNFGVQITELL